MAVVAVTLRDFRSYERACAHLGAGLTVLWGPNGAGKTNLLEALYFGCTGRSCRTANDREVVRFGADVCRVVVDCEGPGGPHEFTVGFAPGEPKRMTADGAPVERLLDNPFRPLASVFLPDRLELIKGVPAGRRAHLDQLVGALWPHRAIHRRAYAQALAQRNAQLARVRAGIGSTAGLDAWDQTLAQHGINLIAARAAAIDLLTGPFARVAGELGLDTAAVAYRPRSSAPTAVELATELADRRASDLERGFTGHGPHRDDVQFAVDSRDVRTFGSQGQQRIALLALLMAERELIAQERGEPPLLLLDDVMSELDGLRRGRLIALIQRGGGQALITTTDLDHVPGAGDAGVNRIAVSPGGLLQDALAA
jgi:DNA replication and repair protein RecF